MTRQQIDVNVLYDKNSTKLSYFLFLKIDQTDPIQITPVSLNLWLGEYSVISIQELDELLHTNYPNTWPEPLSHEVQGLAMHVGSVLWHELPDGRRVAHRIVGMNGPTTYSTVMEGVEKNHKLNPCPAKDPDTNIDYQPGRD